jgi:uncharacterized protein YuzE
VDTIPIDKQLIPFLLQLPARQVWMDYDAEGDVLYLSFAMPQQATDSVMGEDGNVYHCRGEQLVGVTILHASTQAQAAKE